MSEHEIRYARAVATWLVAEAQSKLKQAHKQLGKQGETIHQLRAEVNSLTALTDPENRHRMQLWLDGSGHQRLLDTIASQGRTIRSLQEKITRHDTSARLIGASDV